MYKKEEIYRHILELETVIQLSHEYYLAYDTVDIHNVSNKFEEIADKLQKTKNIFIKEFYPDY